ncbi:MAG TPA: hypothetical protein VHL59_07650 [Thermoanaerobaculia bacterium]|nr:hypothetical protein [Thermoanaerobaculia bacterium]
MLTRLAVAGLLAALLPLQAAALETEDLLALVAMPLAVAAVSEMTDVPTSELVDVVTLLNDAAVPPAQFVEVVRYVPVALVVENDEPDFVEFVRLRQAEGLRGTQLVTSIEERIHLLGVPDADLDVTAPRVIVFDDNFIPAAVRTRVAEVKAHPHGGPPGQLKKAAGVQTGAEIVHGTRRGRGRGDGDGDGDDRRVVENRKPAKQRVVRVDDDDDRGRGGGNSDRVTSNRGRGRGSDNAVKPQKRDGGGGPGRGNSGGDGGGGKGKGKGKG